MLTRIALAVLVGCALLPAAAAADDRVGRAVAAASSLGGLRMPGVPLPEHYAVSEAECPLGPSVVACADVEAGTIYAPRSDRFAFWHEVGHVFDHQNLSAGDRAWFTAVLGFSVSTPWEPRHEDAVESPSEFFADAYAACALRLSPAGHRRGRVRISDWNTAYGYHPTVAQHRRVCRGIAQLGRL